VKKTLPQRLEHLFNDLGVNQMDFARKTGYGQSYISQILNGTKTNPSSRFFKNICREFNINPEWLINGKGEVYIVPDGMDINENAQLLAKFRLLPKHEQRIIEEMINALLTKSSDNEQKIKSKTEKTKRYSR